MSTLRDYAATLNADKFAYQGGLPMSILAPRLELVAAVEDLDLDEQEEKIVRWMMGFDGSLMSAVASIVRKAKSAVSAT